ncbi:uncharacterized protein LOC113954911 isoform X2 [Corapipo altera]|uniref:uncharacterized protein LOC113954911 isoform X2 n=1 Tax=Corapipo altera TaxID=415028 RepID=UPI000FD66955|nr:uncharacterized protein LOC113954911 isoform X2 [Corapipo altera]
MWNCCTLLLEFLGSNAAKFQLLPCPGVSLEKGEGSGACSAALGQPFLSLCNKWINLLFIEKKKDFFSPLFFSFFTCLHLVGILWAVLAFPGWFCVETTCVLEFQGGSVPDPWAVLHSQGGFVWIQPLCWNSGMVLCRSMVCAPFPEWISMDSTSLLEFQGGSVPDPWSVLEFQGGSVQIHGLYSIPRVDFYGSNLCAGIPGWFSTRSMVLLHSQGGFLWIQPLCWNSRVVLCRPMVCTPFPEWISMDPTSLLEFQDGSVPDPWSVLHSRVDFFGSNLSAGIPGWFCADPWFVLHSQSGFLWIQPLYWNSRVVLCQIHGLCWNSRLVLYQIHGLCSIPGWISLDPTSLLEFQDGSVQIHGLCSIPRVDFYGSNLCAGIPGWFCADPAAPAGSAKHYTTFPKENPCFPGPSQAPTNSINPGPGALKPDLNPGGSSSVLARTGGRLCK